MAETKRDAQELGLPWPNDKDADAKLLADWTTKMIVHQMKREIDRALPNEKDR